jgi:hypothetical protein
MAFYDIPKKLGLIANGESFSQKSKNGKDH